MASSTRLNGACGCEACQLPVVTRCFGEIIKPCCDHPQHSYEPASPKEKEIHCALCTFPFEDAIARQACSGQPRILAEDSKHTRLTDANIASTGDRTDTTFILATEPYGADRRGCRDIPARRYQAHVKTFQETRWECYEVARGQKS